MNQSNKYPLKPKFTINFEKMSIDVFYDFISIDPNLKSIYLYNDNYININLIEYDFIIYLFFIDCVEQAYNCILNSKYYNLKLFGDINLWNFCIVHNVMFNYPFTLSNIIYMPITYIIDNYNKNNLKNLSKTIIHEKMHVGQRFNEIIWTKFVQNNNWIKINKSDKLFLIVKNNIESNDNNLINHDEIFILNPDTFYLNFKYLYKLDNKLYYGQYVYNINKKNIYIKYFELNVENEKLLPTNQKFKQEHPYEFYAYAISDELI